MFSLFRLLEKRNQPVNIISVVSDYEIMKTSKTLIEEKGLLEIRIYEVPRLIAEEKEYRGGQGGKY